MGDDGEGDGGLRGLLNDRLLIMVNDRSATHLLPYVDERTGGLVLTGADAPTRCRQLRNTFPDTVVAVDLAGHEHAAASAHRPFGHWAGGRWRPLDLPGVEEILNGQLASKAAFAVTPTGFLPADDTGDARVLRAVIDQANRLRRTDTVVLLPCSWRWLRGASLIHLIRETRASRHPVALIMQHSDDPLKAKGVAEGLRQLCRSCPGLMLWRTDLAVFDAMAHGAAGGAVGASAALRHGMTPRPRGGGRAAYPAVLLGSLLEYRRVETLRHWAALLGPWTCGCPVCEGRTLSRFANSPAGVLEAQRHNAYELYALHRTLASAAAGWERLEWWRQIVYDATARHHQLASRLWQDPTHPPVLDHWLQPSPPPFPSCPS